MVSMTGLASGTQSALVGIMVVVPDVRVVSHKRL